MPTLMRSCVGVLGIVAFVISAHAAETPGPRPYRTFGFQSKSCPSLKAVVEAVERAPDRFSIRGRKDDRLPLPRTPGISSTAAYRAMVWTPDSKSLVTAAVVSGSKSNPATNIVTIWDVAKGKPVQTPLRSEAIDLTKHWWHSYAHGGESGRIGFRSWSWRWWWSASGHNYSLGLWYVHKLAIDRYGHSLAWTDLSGRGFVYDVVEKRYSKLFTAPGGIGNEIAFSPSGDKLVVGGLDIPHEVELGAPEPARRQGAGEAAEPIYATGFSADGSLIFGRHVQGTLTLWNADTLELLRSFDIARGKGRWNATALAADGKSVVCTCEPAHDTIVLISTETGEVIREFEDRHDGHITALSIHPEGKLIASAAMDGTVKVWDTVSGGLISTIRGPPANEKPVPVLALARVGVFA